MAFRDDSAALQSRVEIIEREVADLTADLARAAAEGQHLEVEIARQRRQLRRRRALEWVRRHKVIVGLLILVVTVPTALWVSSHLKERRARAAREALLAKQGCHARLKVLATYSGATVWKVRQNDLPPLRFLPPFELTAFLGETPLELPVCPGTFWFRVAHDRALPWQQLRPIASSGTTTIQATLIPWNPGERPPGILINSFPQDAVLFLEGQEVGRTPYLLTSSPQAPLPEHLAVALAAPGHQPLFVRARTRPAPEIWLQLQPRTGGAHGIR